MKYIISIAVLIMILLSGCAKNNTISYTSTTSKENTNSSLKLEKTDTTIIKEQKNDKKVFDSFDSNANFDVLDEDTICIVYPSNDIGKYALDAINSINTYLIYKNSPFKAVMYDIKTQNEQNFKDIFTKLKKENKTKVLALFTEKFFTEFKDYDLLNDLQLYFPLINIQDQTIKNYSEFLKYDITFAGISYKNQIAALDRYSKSEKTIDLYDNSGIGSIISSFMPKKNLIYKKEVNDQNAYYKSFLKKDIFDDSTLFLNTPIIKSSILLSQMTANELEVKNILSTQLNYSPLIFSLTQKTDRKNITIASSIGHIPYKLLEVSTLTNSDIQYNWVNYASLVGVEYLKNRNVDLFKDLKLENKQIIYPVYLYKVNKFSFRRIN